MEQAGNAARQALQDAYTQIQIEFQYLGFSVAVTYPLVEYVAVRYGIEGDFAFLTDIIWSETDRLQEVQNVAQAAFGPLAAVVRLSLPAPAQRD